MPVTDADIERVKLREQVARVREETGARLIALGEHHNHVGNIKAIRADLAGFKADGYTSFYFEIGTNHQGLIDRAVSGDLSAQRDLRLKFERWIGFYGGTEAAQQRYDLLFDAKRAGFKVLAVDMDDRMDHMQRFNSLVEDEEHQELSARLAIGDAVISGNIKRLDDGGQALLLIGKAHTYIAAPGGHIEDRGTKDEAGYYQSQHGGATARLNASGIATASIDFKSAKSGIGTLERDDGRSADYQLSIPHEEYTPGAKYHVSTGYRVYWDRLAEVYDHAAINAETGPDKAQIGSYKTIAAGLRNLSQMLDDPAFIRLSAEQQEIRLGKITAKLNDRVQESLMHLNDQIHLNAAHLISYSWLLPKNEENPNGEATWRELLEDNRLLQQPAARAMWERPAAMAGHGQSMDMGLAIASLMPKKSSEPELQLKAVPVAPEALTR